MVSIFSVTASYVRRSQQEWNADGMSIVGAYILQARMYLQTRPCEVCTWMVRQIIYASLPSSLTPGPILRAVFHGTPSIQLPMNPVDLRA
jgi:hypothetical protein